MSKVEEDKGIVSEEEHYHILSRVQVYDDRPATAKVKAKDNQPRGMKR